MLYIRKNIEIIKFILLCIKHLILETDLSI